MGLSKFTFVGIFLLLPSAAEAKTMCLAEPIGVAKVRWSWRTIDGKQCWYDGKAMKAKETLFWPTPLTMAEPEPEPAWEAEHRWPR